MGIKISDLSLNQWNSLVKDHLNVEGQLGSHKFIFINNQEQISHFETTSAAKGSGFSTISLPELIKFTQNKIKECNDPEQVQTAENLLIRLKELQISQISSCETKLITQTFESTLSQVHVEPSLCDKETKLNLYHQLDHLFSLRISKDGTTRVYFLTSPDVQSGLILKLVEDPTKHILADRYFQKLGYRTPKYQAISMQTDSDLGKKALNAIKRQYPNVSEDYSHITVLEYVEGTSISQLSMNQQIEVFENEDVLRNLGEMIFHDCVIGNLDRISFTSLNLGNVMMLIKGECDEKGRSIALIDHDYNLTDNAKDHILENLKKLLDKDPLKNEIKKLINRYDLQDDVDLHEVFEKIWDGVKIGIEHFLQVFSDKSQVDSMLKLPNDPNFLQPNPDVFKQIVDFISNESIK